LHNVARPRIIPPVPVITRLKVRHFRCFEHFETAFSPGLNFIVGPNAQGKTSLLEAACILLRLQSPRVAQLARVVQHGRRGFVTDGYLGAQHLQFYYSTERKKLALDGVEQGSSKEWLSLARVVWFGNEDLGLADGPADPRRRFLDFIAVQRNPGYRAARRAYDHALRSRNHLLKQPGQRWREIAAFDAPLLQQGELLATARRNLLAELQADADAAHFAISGQRESLRILYVPGDQGNFPAALATAKPDDARLRQTTVGPHRDDVHFFLNGLPASDASEGQQRTLVLALKLGAVRLLEKHFGMPPVLLLDDIFGELDPARRNALLAALPSAAQKIITTTHLDWRGENGEGEVLRLESLP
jgi:DNA replication and repair protein RecF